MSPFYCTGVLLVQHDYQTDLKNMRFYFFFKCFLGFFPLTNVDSFGTIFYPDWLIKVFDNNVEHGSWSVLITFAFSKPTEGSFHLTERHCILNFGILHDKKVYFELRKHMSGVVVRKKIQRYTWKIIQHLINKSMLNYLRLILNFFLQDSNEI